MGRYIICYGIEARLDVVEAPNASEAYGLAVARSLANWPEPVADPLELADCTWAEPYSMELAAEVGWFDPEMMTAKEIWRTEAPWR